jgi:hypothetical protein
MCHRRQLHRGTLVDAFGVYSNPAVSVFLRDVPIRQIIPPGAAAVSSTSR